MEEKKLVYVVVTGYYSDKRIWGAYETEEEAKEACKHIWSVRGRYQDESDYARYCTLELGVPHINRKKNLYAVEFDKEGRILNVELVKHDDDRISTWREFEAEDSDYYHVVRYGNGSFQDLYLMANDEIEATKIASDMVAEYKYRHEVEGEQA